MNKAVTKIGCLLLSAMSVVSIAACGSSGNSSSGGKTNQIYDTETRPLVFSTDALDGNFNPFFATSATDSTIAAITQVGMMTSDRDGNPICGNDVPTVALDYKTTLYDGNGNVTTDASRATKANGGSTTYEFVIKNGMKFSNGSALTIKDVLFNLYVYLDPMYMGSATIYSTDIKGLNAYRMQELGASDDAPEQNAQFESEAAQRMDDLLGYLRKENSISPQIEKDIQITKDLYREYLESAWSMYSGAYESYKDEYFFTEGWQIFYYGVGVVNPQLDAQNRPVRSESTEDDEDGKYLTDLDPHYISGTVAGQHLIDSINDVRDGKNPDYDLDVYMEDQGCTREEAGEYAVRDFAIDTAYAQTEIESELLEIIYFDVYYDLIDEFVADAKSAWFEELKKNNDGLLVKTISGITTYKTDKFNGKNLGETHDVLKIEINGVDPKAIWNFSFSVAPMYYYSGDYVNENGENVTTLSDAQNDQGTATVNGVPNQYVNFGVNFNNKEFFETVLRNTDKNGLPVGAGVYKASNAPSTNEVNRKTFYRNNWVYFERNTEFDSMGGDAIYDAKIKYMRYRVVSSNNIIQSLRTEAVDFGAPQATSDNMTEISGIEHLGYKPYRTNGYGYVGINPKFVPDIEVRRAIMMAMDTEAIVPNYYKNEDLAEPVYRSMSKESWAYPATATERYYPLTRDKAVIEQLLRDAQWEKGTSKNSKGVNIWEKNGEKLNITFTIAGESTDHPAHDMFQDAKDFLEDCGFKISVVTDINALKNLASGNLAVWAAAWNSTIDPDLYQVYHKDSSATSIKNWGYEEIYDDTTGQFDYEKEIIDELSLLIEQGRETLDDESDLPTGRKAIYSRALDLIMELAVELPTYQRSDLVVYNTKVIDVSTLNQNPSANEGVYDRLWEVNYR